MRFSVNRKLSTPTIYWKKKTKGCYHIFGLRIRKIAKKFFSSKSQRSTTQSTRQQCQDLGIGGKACFLFSWQLFSFFNFQILLFLYDFFWKLVSYYLLLKIQTKTEFVQDTPPPHTWCFSKVAPPNSRCPPTGGAT